MRLQFSDVNTFKSLTNALSLIDEGTFVATPEKLYLSEMDPAKVAMVEVDLPKTVFEVFEVSEQQVFRVSIDRLKKIARKAKSNDTVTWILDTAENCLKVVLEGNYTKRFTVSLMEAEYVEPRSPNIPVIARIKLTPSTLREIINAIKDDAEYVILKADLSKLVFEGHGFSDGVLVELRKDDDVVLEFTVPEPCSAIYPVSFLEDMVKVSVSDIVSILFATDTPLKLSYLINGGGRINYFLAPKREQP
ncbi:MAG TPA: hypothetical protein ENG16_00680 [Archaeoglobus sp.]|nr:hypothetical protein [Archaeoglobus sp.]